MNLLSNFNNNNNQNIYKTSSNNSLYDSNYYKTAKFQESLLVNRNFQNSKNAIDKNIIPRNFQQEIINENSMPIKYLQKNSNNSVSNLSGLTLNKKDFLNKNVQPFFGKNIRQNIDKNANRETLQNHTGTENFNRSKSTPKPLFEPTYDNNIQYGTQNSNSSIQSRNHISRLRNNETPFEKVYIGPGLNKGFSSTPSGGFHQDIREHVIPKTVDELRNKCDPKISFKGRVISGKGITKTTKKPNMQKNRPDTFFVNSEDRYFTTTGAVVKEKQRPCIISKETNRKHSKSYSGSAGPATKKNQSNRSLYKKSTKNLFLKDGPRNAFDKDGWKNEKFGDYGKKSINLPDNERDITQKRTHISNLVGLWKALTAPFSDVFRTTKKENVIGNIRQTGNIGTGGVTKNVAWDPNDTARTTIKETNIHDTRTGNMDGPKKNVAWDPNDVARTTIKETNIHDNRTGNMDGPKKNVVWDPNDIAKTTIKETNIHDTRTGNIQTTSSKSGAVLDTQEMKFKTTIRETLTPEDTILNMKVNSKLTVKDPNDVAKTTIKETNIHNNRTGNLRGPKKLTVYDPNDVAKTTIKETNIHNNRTGNMRAIKRDGGYQNSEIEAPNTNRQFTSDYEYSGIVDGDIGGGTGYLTNEKEAPNTNRQFTSDYEYEGTADSMYKRPTRYETAYNARTNEVREGTLVGRHPTPESVKLSIGKDKINVKFDKIEGDVINTRQPATNKIYNSIMEMKNCSVTQEKNHYNQDIMAERINPNNLKPFISNPYTQSLKSYNYT